MKKLLITALLSLSLYNFTLPAIKYSKKRQMYYSTGLTKNMNAERYHCLAEFCNFLVENAKEEGVSIESIFDYIKQELFFDGSSEAMLLLQDLTEIFGQL